MRLWNFMRFFSSLLACLQGSRGNNETVPHTQVTVMSQLIYGRRWWGGGGANNSEHKTPRTCLLWVYQAETEKAAKHQFNDIEPRPIRQWTESYRQGEDVRVWLTSWNDSTKRATGESCVCAGRVSTRRWRRTASSEHSQQRNGSSRLFGLANLGERTELLLGLVDCRIG